MSEDLITAWTKDVKRTAAFIAGDFPDVEREDLVQHLFMKILENRQYLKSPDERGATKLLLWWGRAYAFKMRTEHLQLSSQYSYRPSDVRHILETVFDQRDWENVRVPDDAKSEFNDVFLELNTDVKRGFQSLGRAQQQVIFERYALGYEHETNTEAKRLSRAIQALTDKLNFYQRPPGSQPVGGRRTMSNAAARYQIKNQLED